MATKKTARPVKPLSGERVAPDAAWQLTRFSDAAAKAAAELDEAALESLREKVRPQLEAEIEQLKAQARAAAHEQGYQAGLEQGRQEGFEAGRAEGLAAAQAEVDRLRASASTLIEALRSPLQAWDEALVSLMAKVVGESLRRFLVADEAARIQLMQTQLKHVISELGQRPLPVTISAHPETLTRLKSFLDAEQVDWHPDPSMSEAQVHVRQDVAEVVVDWNQVLEAYLETLTQRLKEDGHASADASAETEA